MRVKAHGRSKPYVQSLHVAMRRRHLVGAAASLEALGYADFRRRRAERSALAPAPRRVDADYTARYLAFSRCAGPNARAESCRSFVELAFLGEPLETLPRSAVEEWLRAETQGDVGAVRANRAQIEALTEVEFPQDSDGSKHSYFSFGSVEVKAQYKPLVLQAFLAGMRTVGRALLYYNGFSPRETSVPHMRLWVRRGDNDGRPPRMFLHGFGLGFASPVLFAYLSCAPPTSLLAEFEYANVGGPIAETVPTTRAVAKALAVALSEALGPGGYHPGRIGA